jgi:hypothetical protein
MTKAELSHHIADWHPALVWPDNYRTLRLWSREELDQAHSELHERSEGLIHERRYKTTWRP